MRTLFQNPFTAILAGVQLMAISMLASCSQEPLDPAGPAPAPETRVSTLTLESNGITMQVFDWTKDVYTNQRLTFRLTYDRMTMYGDDKVKIEIIDMADGQKIPHSYDPGMTNYYFFTASAPGCIVKATLVEHPEITGYFELPTFEGGVFMKLVEEQRWIYYDPTYELTTHAIHFFADKACTRPVKASRYMSVKVTLIKVAADIFPDPTSNIYRHETVQVGPGDESCCSGRLLIVHETLPSGALLEDYYEYEFVRFND